MRQLARAEAGLFLELAVGGFERRPRRRPCGPSAGPARSGARRRRIRAPAAPCPASGIARDHHRAVAAAVQALVACGARRWRTRGRASRAGSRPRSAPARAVDDRQARHQRRAVAPRQHGHGEPRGRDHGRHAGRDRGDERGHCGNASRGGAPAEARPGRALASLHADGRAPRPAAAAADPARRAAPGWRASTAAATSTPSVPGGPTCSATPSRASPRRSRARRRNSST